MSPSLLILHHILLKLSHLTLYWPFPFSVHHLVPCATFHVFIVYSYSNDLSNPPHQIPGHNLLINTDSSVSWSPKVISCISRCINYYFQPVHIRLCLRSCICPNHIFFDLQSHISPRIHSYYFLYPTNLYYL